MLRKRLSRYVTTFVILRRYCCFFSFARQRFQPERQQKFLLIRTGPAALAYVYLLPGLATDACCYSHLGTHRCAYLVPAVVYSLRFEFASNLMHQIVSQQGNKNVSFDTVCFLMVNWSHTQF